jgi:hypothetical protein
VTLTRRAAWAALLPDAPASVGALDPNQKVTITVWHGQTAEVFADNLRNAQNPRPTIEGYLGRSEDIGTAIGRALVAGEDPKKVLDEAVQQANVDLVG